MHILLSTHPGDLHALQQVPQRQAVTRLSMHPKPNNLPRHTSPFIRPCPSFCPPTQATFTPYSKFRNVRLSWNRGVLTQILTEEQSEWAARLRATGLRPPYALGCILRFLLKPNAEVRQLLSGLEREVHAPGLVTIGVHIRFTDGTVWEGTGGLVVPPPLEVRWLVITNSVHFKLAMHQQYQNKVVTTPFTPLHSNKLSDNAISTNATSEVIRILANCSILLPKTQQRI
ncbi:unnamed protein product [Closterium sp. Yama58-4]|nr:unnamed protein product [Closterium sp. Yama58-4]